MKNAPRILVAGVGNELMSDDGIGVYVVRELQKEPMPGVEMVEIGTAMLHGLSFLEKADRVLVIDAARGGKTPGTVYLFDAATPPPMMPGASIHAIGLREAARLLPAGCPAPAMTILGVEPERVEYGMGLSRVLCGVVPGVVALARKTLEEWRTGETVRGVTEKPVAGEKPEAWNGQAESSKVNFN